jgi:myxalamid-type polyketide synthase MxaB
MDEQALMKKAVIEIRELRAKLESQERAKIEPIAVIGMSCRFPGAPNPAAYWDLLAGGVDAITEVPKDRWDVDEFYDPDPDKPGKMYTRWGGFLNEVDRFSPAFFGISPREAASMDPQQRLLLEVSWEALENAATPVDRLQNSQVGVFVGIGATDYSEVEVLQGPETIDPYNGTGQSFCVAAGRLSYALGVRGPCMALDTACSTSLVAVHLAVVSLRNRESTIALAGGVNLIASPESFISLCKARMLSPDGRCKTFDAGANGYVRSEGCGMLVLKRLQDAIADKDNILAVIRGSAVNHNGRSSGLTVTSGPAQQTLIRQALQNAGLESSDVSYVEAHGTGTAVGDPIEVGALASVFDKRSQPLLIGSVKSNLGHMEWAAGVGGLIKVILSMRHGQIPASLHVKELNPLLDWSSLPLRVVTQLTPWPEGRRLAGVSSFGFGGTNAHVVIEEPPGEMNVLGRSGIRKNPGAHPTTDIRILANSATNNGRDAAVERPLHGFTISAKTDAAMRELAGRYATALTDPALGCLEDICHTANAGRSHFEHRLATVVASASELQQRLSDLSAGEEPAEVRLGRVPPDRPKIAMLFTGQGSQYPGMGRELFDTQPVFRDALERCNAVLRDYLERPLLEVLYPAEQSSDAQRQWINQTAYTQPALFALEYALAECWQSWGVRPHIVLGHSTGEFVAACLGGVFSLEDGLRLIAERARLMQALPPGGAMLAVRAPQAVAERMVAPHRDAASIAAVNGPRDIVLSGESKAIEAIAAQLQAEGFPTQPLTVSHAFHSPLMDPMLPQFERVAQAVRYNPPRLAMISAVTGKPAQSEMVDPTYWVRHVREAVRFTDGMAALAAEGCDVFLEIGPKPTLLGLGKQCIPDDGVAWLPSLRTNRGDWQQMLDSLCDLYLRGADIDWAGFDHGYPRRKVTLPTYPFERQPYPLPKSNQRSRNGSGTRYPLVDTLVQSPLVKETIFTTAVSTAVFPYLADHSIFGEVVAPAGFYLAMMLNGARRLGQSSCRIADVFFVAPLVLADKEERTVQAVLEPEGGFRIISLASNEAPKSPDEMVTHVSGRMGESGEPSEAQLAQLADIQARCTRPVDVAALAAIEGIEFGPSFQWIESLWSGPGETLAQLRQPEAVGNAEGYWLHPGLLDACFQAAGATLQAESANEVLLPFGVKSLDVVAPASGTSWWCHCKQIAESLWDIRLFSDSGEAIADLQGFEMRKASGEAFQNRRTADWIYRVEWQPQPPQAKAAPATDGAWLIVDKVTGLGNDLGQRLRQRGQDAVLAVEDDEVAPMLANPPHSVVYVCGAGEDSNVPATAEAASVRLLHLVQSLNRACAAPHFYVVTLGSQAVTNADPVRPAPATLWGFARTLQLEAPALRCVCVDLPAQPAAQDLDALVSELTTPSPETQIAYRSGERFVARLVRHRDNAPPKLDAPFRLQLAEYGSPDQLRLVPLTRRSPGPGEVEIDIKAASLNFRDVLITLGMLRDYYVHTFKIDRAQDVRLGFDCAGTTAAVGEGVTDLKVGDEVMTFGAGSFASFLTLTGTDVVRKPAGISFETASAIPTVFYTAYYCLLQLARLRSGERVLIHAAAGGVGQAAVQLAQAVGAEIFATASPGKWDVLKSQGVHHIMNSRTLDFADEIQRLTQGKGVDVVLNSLTGDAIDRSFAVLKQGGRFVEIGKLGIWTPEQVAARRPDVAYNIFDLFQAVDENPASPRAILGQVREWFESGRLQPLPQRVFPVQDAVQAYRNLQQARQVGKVVLSFAPEEATVVAGDGSYLVTGGLGGLGLEVAQQLVEQGARHLVLAGRSRASAAGQDTIERLRSTGVAVQVVQADIANSGDVARLIELCQAEAPLRGIVHAAGVLDDGVLDKQTDERFARVLAPKVRGAWQLHDQTQELPLDFFVCFSSMASIMGSAGQCNYAAANAFLDALAAHRRARGLPGLSINWGPWAEVGMAAGLALAGQGLDKLEVADGLHLFADLLWQSRGAGPAQVGVMRVNWPQFARGLPAGETPPFLSALIGRAVPAKKRSAASDQFLRRYHATPAEERMTLLESAIHEELVHVLKLEASRDIPPTQQWADLGLDSLMMVELKNRVEGMLRITLPIERMARDISTRALAGFLLDKLNDAAPPDANGAAPVQELRALTQPGSPQSKTTVLSSQDDLEKAYQLIIQIPQAFVTAEKQNGRRILSGGRWRYDFASCNYLGMDFHPEVVAAIGPAIAEWGVHPSWTRAVASPRLYDDLERELAAFVGAPTTLVFPSISLLHMGVLPILAGYDGVILKDTEAHHTIHEACLRAQVNGAEWHNFPHSDIDDLEKKLRRYRPGRTKIIATDGVYSMGSSHPPLFDYVRLAKQYDALLYVDDAHGFGIIGEKPDEALPYGYRGNGMVRHFGLDYCADRIVYVAGMSKAFSSYAAFVTCFDDRMKYNFQGSGPFVFSGPTCVASLASALAGLRVNAREGDEKRRHVFHLTHRLVTAARDLGFEVDNGGFFPIVGVVMGGFELMVKACQLLWEHDILITPAIYPAVPINRNLVRFSITAANTEEELDHAIGALKAVRDSLDAAANGAEPASTLSALVSVS